VLLIIVFRFAADMKDKRFIFRYAIARLANVSRMADLLIEATIRAQML
jgi:hypothetical protein